MRRAGGQEWTRHARREIARAGHRAGGARGEVMQVLATEPCLMSAQEIHDALRARDRGVGLASVYRALDVLGNLRLVHRVEVGGTACYEAALPSGEHHHHAICNRCGQREPFEDDDLEKLIDAVGERVGFDVDAHDVVLKGVCRDCR